MIAIISAPVAPSLSSDLGIGVEMGAVYEMIGEDGYRAVINDSTDRDFVGFLTDLPTGLDAAGVRESAETRVEGDGGIHGAFWADRRPVTFTGIVDPTPRAHDVVSDIDPALVTAVIADRRMNRLQRATRAKRGNARIRWKPANAPPVELAVKRQQPVRFGGRLPKTFFVGMVAADHRIFAQAPSYAAGRGDLPTIATSYGNTDTPPVITLRGAWLNPTILNAQTGAILALAGNGGLRMGPTDVLVLDINAGTAVINGIANVYDRVDFLASEWWNIQPGPNPVAVGGGGTGQSFGLTWRDAWE